MQTLQYQLLIGFTVELGSKTTPEQLDLFDALSLPRPAIRASCSIFLGQMSATRDKVSFRCKREVGCD